MAISLKKLYSQTNATTNVVVADDIQDISSLVEPNAYTAGNGLSVSNDVFSIDENVVATKSYVEELVGNIEDLINGI